MNGQKLTRWIPAFFLVGLALFAFVVLRPTLEDRDETQEELASAEDTNKDSKSAPRDNSRRQAEEREVIRRLAPNSPELLRLQEGDFEGLRKEFREKSGLELREIRKNTDGSYDIVAGTLAPPARGEEPFLPEDVRELYREKYLKSANQGRVPSLDARDRQEIEKFRKSLEPQ